MTSRPSAIRLAAQLPARLSATGMVGLAALSATHWLRQNVLDPGPVLVFTLGIMPSLAAAFAMPLIAASITPRTSPSPTTKASRDAFIWVLAVTTCGLSAWELAQTHAERLVFDAYDIVATAVGSILAYLAFGWHVRGVTDRR